MLSPIILQTKLNYKWSNEHANIVAFEYDRFMKLRSEDENLSPCDDIDRFWHQHILNTRHYNSYCFEKFKKFVHHDPTDSFDQLTRHKRLSHTINNYVKTFGPIINNDIWKVLPNADKTNIPNGSIKSDIINKPIALNTSTISNPLISNPLIPLGAIKVSVEIIYVFDVIDKNGKFDTKKWVSNDKIYDKKIIPIQLNKSKPFTVSHLKKFIEKITNHNQFAIKIYSHNKNKEFIYLHYETKNYLNNEIDILNLVNGNNSHFVAILEEMTSNGFC